MGGYPARSRKPCCALSEPATAVHGAGAHQKTRAPSAIHHRAGLPAATPNAPDAAATPPPRRITAYAILGTPAAIPGVVATEPFASGTRQAASRLAPLGERPGLRLRGHGGGVERFRCAFVVRGRAVAGRAALALGCLSPGSPARLPPPAPESGLLPLNLKARRVPPRWAVGSCCFVSKTGRGSPCLCKSALYGFG